MTNTSESFAAIESETRERCAIDLSTDGMYTNVLKGCFVKCFEFAQFCHVLLPKGKAMFAAATLRGICEDFIALRYLQTERSADDRDELLSNKMMSLVFDAALKQHRFFSNHRAFQPVFSGQPKTPVPKSGLPTVRDMAAVVGLSDLYDFMYSITSDVVHFNPRVIVRNAWGKDNHRFEHSVENFDVYYTEYCRTYSVYFLCEFATTFAVELALSLQYTEVIAKLKSQIDNKLRWPEAVTFEEMNLDGPSGAFRVLMKMSGKPLEGEVA